MITSALALALHAQTPVARAGDCDDGIDQAQFQDNGWKPKDKNDKKPPHRLKKAECEGCQKFYDDLQKALDDCYAKQLEDIGDIDYSAPGVEEKQKKKNDAKDALGGAKEAAKAKAPKGKSQQDLKDEVKKKWEALKGQLGRCKESPYPGLLDLVTLPEFQPPPRGTTPTPTPTPTPKPSPPRTYTGPAQSPTPTPQEHGMAPRQPGKTGETCAVLIATGKINVETSGTGETIGHVADLKIQNSTDQPLTCAIPPMILESGSGKNQHYACPRGQTVALNPHQTKTVPMNGVCLNRNKPPVGKGISGDLVMNEANPSGPQNPNSHLPSTDAGKLLRSCAAKYTAADQLQKSGALKNLPYHDPQKQKDIVVQWSTWTDPQICQIVGTTPATKDDLKKVVYKQVEQQGPMTPEKKKKVDQGIDTIFEKVELTTAKAKDLEKPGPFFEGPISTEKPGPLFKPATVAQLGDVVHVEEAPTGGNGHWMVKVKLPSGEIVEVWFEAADKPPLEVCNWIKINKTGTSSSGKKTVVKDYEKTTAPTPPPTTALTPTATAAPTATPPPTPAPTPTPTPCKEGETRDLSSETKEFKILDPDGVPIFQCYTNKDSAIAAGNGLSDYFKNGAKIADKMKEHLPPGVGTTVAGWLIGYVKGGSQILDAVLAGRLRTAGVSSVTAAIDLPVKEITATCTTYEICRHGVWVTEKKFSESVEHTRLKDSQTADANNQSNGQWEKVADDNSRYDLAKAEAWAKQFLDDHLKALDQAEKDYKDFKDKCK